ARARVLRAAFTALAPRNTTATSGSSVTTIAPCALREAYLLRRARLKSSSGRTSAAFRRRASAVLALALFIVFALTACHLPCADQPNRIAPLREHYHEQTTPKRSSPSEWRRSSIIRPSGSPNTVTASSKETPCSTRLSRALWTSHSKRGPRST